MDKLLEYRNQEQSCRQRAAYEPQHSWKWLAEAEMWQHRAREYLAAHFEDCNAIDARVLPRSNARASRATSSAELTPRKRAVGAT